MSAKRSVSSMERDVVCGSTLQRSSLPLTSQEIRDLVRELKRSTLKMIFDMDYQNDVVFVVSFSEKQKTLQFSGQNATSSVQLWGTPFNNSTSKPDDQDADGVARTTDTRKREIKLVSNNFTARRDVLVRQQAIERNTFFEKNRSTRCSDITPMEFVRWCVMYTEGVPIIVSNNFGNLLSFSTQKEMLFFNHCVMTEPFLKNDGSPDFECNRPECENKATYVTNNFDALYCTRHARCTSKELMLYVPLFVGVTFTQRRMQIQIFDLPNPFLRGNPSLEILVPTGKFTTLNQINLEMDIPSAAQRSAALQIVQKHLAENAKISTKCFHYPEEFKRGGWSTFPHSGA